MERITALLLDRDGTLIKDKHYLADPAGVELLPGVAETLAMLAAKGILFFMVSNQSGIGRGMFTKKEVEACNERVAGLLASHGVRFADMVYCPHAPEENCRCRKPDTGLWELLRDRHHLEAAECLMVGDKVDDLTFAARAGLAGRVLVLTGKGAKTAGKLGIYLPGKAFLLADGAPATPEHPHLVITGFNRLVEGLTLLYRGRGLACNV